MATRRGRAGKEGDPAGYKAAKKAAGVDNFTALIGTLIFQTDLFQY
jgi:hypothetical protein